jgi:hypothetical protein
LALTLPLLAGPLTGCGYTQGPDELYPTQYRTVAVPIFENRTFTQNIQFQLTEAIAKQIQSRTPYVIASATAADTVLQGAVLSVDRTPVTRRRGGNLPQELEVAVRIDFEWKDLRTGDIIRSRRGFEAVGLYVPTPGVDEVEATALQTAIDRLAEDLVGVMQNDWGPGDDADTTD